MTPRQLLERKPEKTIKLGEDWFQPFSGFGYCFVPELEGQFSFGSPSPSDRIEFRIYKDYCFDGRRIWRLVSVYFDGKPAMILQNAGREGDDHRERFILDGEAYYGMVAHLATLFPPDEQNKPVVVGMDDDIPGLTRFYGNDLDGVFEQYRY